MEAAHRRAVVRKRNTKRDAHRPVVVNTEDARRAAVVRERNTDRHVHREAVIMSALRPVAVNTEDAHRAVLPHIHERGRQQSVERLFRPGREPSEGEGLRLWEVQEQP